MTTHTETNLTTACDIDKLLSLRDQTHKKIEAVLSALDDLDETYAQLGIEKNRNPRCLDWMINNRDTSKRGMHRKSMAHIDRQCWAYLMDQSGLRIYMDATARAEWQTFLHKDQFPPLTQETIDEAFNRLTANSLNMLERGVIECFKTLSWDYKTNNPCAFGKKIIRSLGNWQNYFFSANDTTLIGIGDLSRMFHLLEGTPIPEYKHSLELKLREACAQRQTAVADNHVSVKLYKNGNAHITFLKPELVEKLNKVLAKHYPNALPQ